MYWEYYVSDIYLPVILLSISWHDPADETQECQVNTTPVGRSSRASGEMDTADAAGLIGGSQRLQSGSCGIAMIIAANHRTKKTLRRWDADLDSRHPEQRETARGSRERKKYRLERVN